MLPFTPPDSPFASGRALSPGARNSMSPRQQVEVTSFSAYAGYTNIDIYRDIHENTSGWGTGVNMRPSPPSSGVFDSFQSSSSRSLGGADNAYNRNSPPWSAGSAYVETYDSRRSSFSEPVEASLGLTFAVGTGPGMTVRRVKPGGPGERAGISINDVVTAVDHCKIATMAKSDISGLIKRAAGKGTVLLTVLRDGRGMPTDVHLHLLPSDSSPDSKNTYASGYGNATSSPSSNNNSFRHEASSTTATSPASRGADAAPKTLNIPSSAGTSGGYSSGVQSSSSNNNNNNNSKASAPTTPAAVYSTSASSTPRTPATIKASSALGSNGYGSSAVKPDATASYGNAKPKMNMSGEPSQFRQDLRELMSGNYNPSSGKSAYGKGAISTGHHSKDGKSNGTVCDGQDNQFCLHCIFFKISIPVPDVPGLQIPGIELPAFEFPSLELPGMGDAATTDGQGQGTQKRQKV